MRGKRRQQACDTINNRIIPAHAGQTVFRRSLFSMQTDHPRACGANRATGEQAEFVGGSSPRMRGKPASSGRVRALARIIPAHAGQTGFPTASNG